MEFDYKYLRNISVVLPIVIFTLCIILLIYTLIKVFSTNCNLKIFRLILLIPCIFIIFLSINQLRYGFKILYDNPKDTTTVTGRVDEIVNLNIGVRYYYDSKPVIPKAVKIDEETYYFITTGDIEIGDIVTITFLNESKYVLIVEYEEG